MVVLQPFAKLRAEGFIVTAIVEIHFAFFERLCSVPASLGRLINDRRNRLPASVSETGNPVRKPRQQTRASDRYRYTRAATLAAAQPDIPSRSPALAEPAGRSSDGNEESPA